MGLLSLSPDLQRNAVAHGTASSSHVRPRFPQPALPASHHHRLAILPVASISSISSPPAWNGRQASLSSRHHYRLNTPRILRTSWSAKLRLLCRGLRANFGARPSTEAASSNPKTRQRRYEPSPPSRIYDTTWMNILTPAQSCSSSASCQQYVAFPTTGMSAPLKLLQVGTVRHVLAPRNCLGSARLDDSPEKPPSPRWTHSDISRTRPGAHSLISRPYHAESFHIRVGWRGHG